MISVYFTMDELPLELIFFPTRLKIPCTLGGILPEGGRENAKLNFRFIKRFSCQKDKTAVGDKLILQFTFIPLFIYVFIYL